MLKNFRIMKIYKEKNAQYPISEKNQSFADLSLPFPKPRNLKITVKLQIKHTKIFLRPVIIF